MLELKYRNGKEKTKLHILAHEVSKAILQVA